MTRRMLGLVIVIMLLIGSAVAAQGSTAAGRGHTARHCATADQTPQGNAYRYGGLGFVNAGDAQGWNECERNAMQRGVGENGVGMYTMLPPASVAADDLPQDVIDLMIAGWNDEQLAYATYEAILMDFGEVRPFTNIQMAESQHIAAWEFLFDRYAIEIPSLPEMERLTFDSIVDACAMSAEIEVANFSLYDDMLDAFEPYPDIYMVTLSLRNASEFNHLPAFERCAG